MNPWTAQTLPQLLLDTGLATLAGIGTVWLSTRSPRTHAALRRILDAPGILVPVFALTMLLWLGFGATGAWPRENPFVGNPWWTGVADSAGAQLGQVTLVGFLTRWLIVALVAAALAGQVGLLEANLRGERPSGRAMVLGVRQHFVAMLLARTLLGLAAFALAASLHATDDLLLPLLLLPGVILAPVLGSTSKWPGRPLRAVHDGLATGFVHLFRHGSLALRELLAMVLLSWSLRQIHASPLDPGDPTGLQELAQVAAYDLYHGGTVSYDHAFLTPFPWHPSAWIDFPALACGLFLQVVFVSAHFEACRQPEAPASRPRS